jgi:glycosyltransferase involved in cell wall biosynthesis
MKIALNTYQAAYQNPGGGEVVLNKHYEHLRARGHQVELFNQWSHKIQDFDLVHNFGSINRDFWFAVKGASIPLVVTPILWPQRSIFNTICAPLGKFFRNASPYTRNPLKVYHEFRLPDRLIVNSQSEAEKIASVFGLHPEHFSVIPNGVDRSFRDADPNLFTNRYQVDNFLLCVGRIANVKNQLGLIRATIGLNMRLVLIGSAEPSAMGYYEQCRKEAPADTLFIDRVEQGSPLLASAFAAARLVVIPSLFETCGIVAMEAGLAGGTVAITKNGGTREYYKEYVSYLDPQSTSTLRKTLLSALGVNNPRASGFQTYIQQNYLWERVMDQTIEIYRAVLRKAGRFAAADSGVQPTVDADVIKFGDNAAQQPIYINESKPSMASDRA